MILRLWNLGLYQPSPTKFKTLSTKFGKILRSTLFILRLEWRTCSRLSQNHLELALRLNSKRTTSGSPPSLMSELNWTNACVSLRAGRIEWQNWQENSGKANQFSINGRANHSLIHILITWSSESMKSLNFALSMMNYWGYFHLKNKRDWMLILLSILSARLILSILMNIRPKTGLKRRQNMRKFWNQWKRKFAKSLEKKSLQKNFLHLNYSENSRDGRDYWVRTPLRKSCRLRETVC